MERAARPRTSQHALPVRQYGCRMNELLYDSLSCAMPCWKFARRQRREVLAFGMVTPITHADIPYRGYALQVTYAVPQWQIAVVPGRNDLPELPGGKQILRGWNQEEIVQRAKRRIDAILEGRHAS
jgi:hypothetical protein